MYVDEILTAVTSEASLTKNYGYTYVHYSYVSLNEAYDNRYVVCRKFQNKKFSVKLVIHKSVHRFCVTVLSF